MASRAMALLAVPAFAIGACSAQLYRGPSRPKTEVAAIRSGNPRRYSGNTPLKLPRILAVC